MDTTNPRYYSQNHSLQHDLGIELLQQYMRWEEGDTVLDAGCGTGEICKYISQQPGVASVVGLDVSSDFVRYACQHNSSPNVLYHVSDLSNADLVNECHDSRLLEECGFEVLSCDLKEQQYSFTSRDHWKKTMSAVFRHLSYIPQDKHEEFLNDVEKMERDVLKPFFFVVELALVCRVVGRDVWA
ncbi:hypothetical protein Bbelb_084700 [Branchiostoma belcheri]|nr:hypothetical protein Bbelb_084700 [Branchiostoma belcheri]